MNEIKRPQTTPKKKKKKDFYPFSSCHHGNSENPNNLNALKYMLDDDEGDEKNDIKDILRTTEIDIIEVDFVTYDNSIVSSHDYTKEGIYNGSELAAWVDYVVYHHRKFLWIDVKQNMSLISCFSSSNGFDASLLLNELDRLRDYYLDISYYDSEQLGHSNFENRHKRNKLRMKKLAENKKIPKPQFADDFVVDISDYIIIGCQDKELFKSIQEMNTTMFDENDCYYCKSISSEDVIKKKRVKSMQLLQEHQHLKPWQTILDIPHVDSYILQYLFGVSLTQSLTSQMISNQFITNAKNDYNYDDVKWIAIDHTFFTDSNSLVEFIIKMKIPEGCKIIIYNIDEYLAQVYKSFFALSLRYVVIFQYDYGRKW